jgi:hypothetical protein
VPHELVPLAVEARGGLAGELAQLAARVVVLEDGELRLCGAEWKRLAPELDALGQDRVLELVRLVGELAHDDAAGTGFTEPIEALAALPPRPLLLGLQRVELFAREEILVAGDDRGLLARLLLADAHRASLLGALVEEASQLRLELVRCPDHGHAEPPSC